MVLTIALIYSCRPQDEIYRDYYNQAYKTNYPQKATNLTGSAGYLSAYLSWDVPASPTCTEAVIYWNFQSDSVKISLADPQYYKEGKICVRVDGLKESDYTFDVFIIDREGSRSLASETLVSPKGPEYVETLAPIQVLNAVVSEINRAGVINWSNKPKYSLFTELRYIDASSVEKTTWLNPSDKTTILRDIDFASPSDFAYRSVFVTGDCVDTLYSAWTRMSWYVDPDYSETVPPGTPCLGFRTRKNGTVTQDGTNPNQYVFDCTGSDISVIANELTEPLTKSVLVFQYKQTLKSTSVKVYWVDKGGSAETRRYTGLSLSEYVSGSDEWSVAVIDMATYWTSHLWAGNVGDWARLDFNTTAGNVITIRNAYFRDKREGE